MIEIVSVVLNALLGGGLIVTLVTLKSARAKGAAEAQKLQLDNVEQATDILIKNIVEPLKKEIYAIRREVYRLRKALEMANGCDMRDSCPVLDEMRKQAAIDYRNGEGENRIRDSPGYNNSYTEG